MPETTARRVLLDENVDRRLRPLFDVEILLFIQFGPPASTAMTVLLKRALERLAQLPERDQDFYAQQLLRELDGDERWAELFALTTDAQWASMVDEARQDAADHGTLSLSDLEADLGAS